MMNVIFSEGTWPHALAFGRIGRAVGVTLVAACALMAAPASSSSVLPCPDAEVVFARGTDEQPGVGGIGQAFVDALRSKAGTKSAETPDRDRKCDSVEASAFLSCAAAALELGCRSTYCGVLI